MNYKQHLHRFLTLAILLCGLPNVWAQNKGESRVAAPAAASGFSTFSLPQNLGATFNAPEMDQLPVQAPSGLSLYFSSARTGGQGAQDIWVSQRATLSSAWGTPQNLGTIINTSVNDTISCLSADGREMFIQSPRTGGTGASDIYISTRTDPNNDFGWTAPVNIGTVINTASNDYMANYFVDPATGAGTLFFNSDRAGGLSLNDIYQSTRNADGTFNPPSLVSVLNSAFSEERTSISRDGLELFFSSNRRVPTTNQAVYVSTRASTSSAWNAPVYVGILNTTGSNAQPGLSPDGTLLYTVSNRPGGSGSGDIYVSTRVSVNRTTTGDFDGDGRTDLTVYRPSNGNWYILGTTNVYEFVGWGGVPDDIPVAGDFDGDGRNDFAIFRSGEWYILRTSDGTVTVAGWGAGGDLPTPGDYDGDGRTDIAVYRGDTWYIIQSATGNWDIRQFGASGDIPIVASRSD